MNERSFFILLYQGTVRQVIFSKLLSNSPEKRQW